MSDFKYEIGHTVVIADANTIKRVGESISGLGWNGEMLSMEGTKHTITDRWVDTWIDGGTEHNLYCIDDDPAVATWGEEMLLPDKPPISTDDMCDFLGV